MPEKMSAINQCDSTQGGIATLPSSVEIFNKFKPEDVDEKESDEESFHLPIDDEEIENKSTHSTENKDSQNGETEEDILNKFDTTETSITPDNLDPKIEDSMLDDGEDMCDTQIKKDISEILNNLNDCSNSTDTSLKSRLKVILKEQEGYEESNDSGEFMSKYESESHDSRCNSARSDVPEAMEVDNDDAKESDEKLEDTDLNRVTLEHERGSDVIEDAAFQRALDSEKETQKSAESPAQNESNTEKKTEPTTNEAEAMQVEECNEESKNNVLNEEDAVMSEDPATQINEDDTVDLDDLVTVDEANCSDAENIDSDAAKAEQDSTPQQDTEGVADEDVDMISPEEECVSKPDDPSNRTDDKICNQAENMTTEDEVNKDNATLENDSLLKELDETINSSKLPENAEELSVQKESASEILPETAEERNVPKEDVSESLLVPAEKQSVSKEDGSESPTPSAGADVAGETTQEKVTLAENAKTVTETEIVGVETAEETKEENIEKETKDDEAIEEVTEEASAKEAQEEASKEAKDDTAAKEGKEVCAANESEEESAVEEAKEESAVKEAKEESAVKEAKEESAVKEAKEESAVKEAEDDIAAKEGKEVCAANESEEESAVKEAKEESAVKEAKEESAVKEAKEESAVKEANEESAVKEAKEESAVKEAKEGSLEKQAKDECEAKHAKDEDAEKDDKEEEAATEVKDEDEADLLDISIVRDAEEDDACAIQTAIADNIALIEDNQTSEKSDDDQEDQTDRTETETEDLAEDTEAMDEDREVSEAMDFEEGEQDSAITPQISDGESKDACDETATEKEIETDGIDESTFIDSDSSQSVSVATDKSSAILKQSKAIGKQTRNENSENVDEETTGDIFESVTKGAKKTVEKTSGTVDKSGSIKTIDSDSVSEKAKITGEKTDSDSSSNKENEENLHNETVSPVESEKTDKSNIDKHVDVGAAQTNDTDFGEKQKESVERPKPKKRTSTVAEVVEENENEPAKKLKLTEPPVDNTNETASSEKVKALSGFHKFMQNKKIKGKITRSDLEQICIQKLCEVIWHKTSEGELHQTIKKQQQIIETLRKDNQQLLKQAKDLETVNRKLLLELKTQSSSKKPLVPLKITRSVGLQVRLATNTVDNNTRKRQSGPPSPRIATPPSKARTTSTTTTSAPTPAPAPVVRQLSVSPQKQNTNTPTNNPLLSQALTARRTQANNTAKRILPAKTVLTPSTAAQQKSSGVIDLTDEDDKTAKASNTSQPRFAPKIVTTAGRGVAINKSSPKVSPQKPVVSPTIRASAPGIRTVNAARAVTTLSQGVRLATNQVKNGSIAIPSISTSGAQLMYVPLSSLTSTAGSGGQKAVFLNLTPASNGVIGSVLGESVVQNKQNTLTVKSVNVVRKHPAPLPSPPRINLDPSLKPVPPKPHLSIRKTDKGIILQWKMPYNLELFESICSYQLYAYQETTAPPSTDMWRKVGDVKALALPMACTLTQFADKNKYYFAVRSVDVHKRIGAFSDPEEICL